MKTDDFFNSKYDENVENDRNEQNYISHFKPRINSCFSDQVGTKKV
jgi:hypothetical protein